MVTEGGGKGWMLHPWQTRAILGGDVDYVVAPGHHCFYKNRTRDMGPNSSPAPWIDGPCACTDTRRGSVHQ